MKRKHTHRKVREEMRGYMGTAIGARENREAHGGVCYVAFCSCGAKRETNSNGRAVERGQWYGGQSDDSGGE